MAKILTGSANDGEKIMKNLDIFSYEFVGKEDNIYKFKVAFAEQKGAFNISMNGQTINESSTLSIDDKRFLRPLGIYNDPSLLEVAKMLMKNLNE